MRLGLRPQLYLDRIRYAFCVVLFFPCECWGSRIFGMSLFHDRMNLVTDDHVDFRDWVCIVGFWDYSSTSSGFLHACYPAPRQSCKDVSLLHEDLAFYISVFTYLKYHRKTWNGIGYDAARPIYNSYSVGLYYSDIVYDKGCVPSIFVSICGFHQDITEICFHHQSQYASCEKICTKYIVLGIHNWHDTILHLLRPGIQSIFCKVYNVHKCSYPAY